MTVEDADYGIEDALVGKSSRCNQQDEDTLPSGDKGKLTIFNVSNLTSNKAV
jgi:hypothetical protein